MRRGSVIVRPVKGVDRTMVGGSGTTSRHSDGSGAGAAVTGTATAIRVLDAGLSISEALCDVLCADVGGGGVAAAGAAATVGVEDLACAWRGDAASGEGGAG